jgi:hypothetical protein
MSRGYSSESLYQSYADFQATYSKKGASTNGQLFGHQLRQVHGCSTSAAATLMDKYGTTVRFMDEMARLGQFKAEVCLHYMCFGMLYGLAALQN